MSRAAWSAAFALPAGLLLVLTAVAADPPAAVPDKIDFNRDVRPILSNTCYACHGPDEKVRKAKLRLDNREGAVESVVVPGKPDASELVKRVTSHDADEVMPPPKTGKKLTAKEVATLAAWVKQGAPYAKHWSYIKPERPTLPAVDGADWPKNAIDHFVLARLEREGLRPQPEADKYALVRRVALDLTGLPPTVEEVDAFVTDPSPGAYERMVDRFLAKPAYGEHWARTWLDLARYADSAGYADDPPRTIWAYRDYVIRSFNANKPFDRFTVEQIAGDLLPNPTEEQLVATAFHRNTLTNNEGGTNDEEFRNVAVVDRVNTTMAVWMGTSMACAQCHTHKFDPIKQTEYFQLFAFLNNTEDADRGDESPVLSLYSAEQMKQKAAWEAEVIALEAKRRTPPASVMANQPKWEASFPKAVKWESPKPVVKTKSGAAAAVKDDGSVEVDKRAKQDTYTVELPAAGGPITALRLETFPGANFVVTSVRASVVPPGNTPAPTGRYVRIELPGKGKILSLAEVQVFSAGANVALKGTAKQSSTGFDGVAKRAIDGNTNGDYFGANSTTHNGINDDDPWWEVDLKATKPVERIVVWNRTDGGEPISARLSDFRVVLLDEQRKPVWEQHVKEFPNPSRAFELSSAKAVTFASAHADYTQAGFDPMQVLTSQPKQKGWSGGDKQHALTLLPAKPVAVPAGSKLVVTIEQTAAADTPGRFKLGVSSDVGAAVLARTPTAVVTALAVEPAKRTAEQAKLVADHYLTVAPELKADQDRLATVRKSLADLKPATTVPIYRELPKDKRRVTKLQHRGNFMDLGETVAEGVPAAFPPLPPGSPLNRLGLAQWLVSPENPLTPRVLANRFWEAIFGTGLVRTSEEFGSQGELPSHPELLDWLACELRDGGWDVKKFLKLIVTSAAYRQSSRVKPEALEKDPDNRLISRGPRFRLPAETVRDQALAAAGLLSAKMYGPSVKPPQPSFNLSAAFGRTLDWQTSAGEDKYRRGLYTEWRRTNPYPSMAAFDAPSREACTIRRLRSNTPMQALVTLNDPVYIEAAQALARRMAEVNGPPAEKVAVGFRRCVARPPSEKETTRVLALYEEAKATYAKDPAKAAKMATDPLGAAPKGADVTELAAWTVVANVLLNLDEMLMRR